MDVYEIYLDCEDRLNKDQGGYFSPDLFNRYSWLGQLRMMDWLSGDVSGVQPPASFSTQKNRDWLSKFINKYPIVVNGSVYKPKDYYIWDNAYTLNGTVQPCDEDEEPIEVKDNAITILDNSKFKLRIDTYIKRLKPTYKNPICKVIGDAIEFYPKDLGNVVVEYVRYPKKAELKMAIDTVYNEEVYDKGNSEDFEWDEFARPYLVWWICQEFILHTTDAERFQLQVATTKSAR